MDRRRIVAMAGALALVVGIGAGAVQAADRDVADLGLQLLAAHGDRERR